VPFGAGKEQRLTHREQVMKKKVLQSGKFGGFLGNSDHKDGPGKKIGDMVADIENLMFAKVQDKPVAQKFSRVQTKSINIEKQIYQWDV
jgi:hypothetical protein